MLKKYSFIIALFFIFLIFGIFNFLSFRENVIIDTFEKAKIEFDHEIDNKLKSTMALSITIANDPHISEIFKGKRDFIDRLEILPKLYRKYTNYKNIWIQLIDKNGISIYRSWSKRKGDDLKNCRKEIKYLLKNPKNLTTLTVCKYTITLNAITPVFEDKKFLGFVDVASHFNSISKNLKKLGFNVVVLADKKVKNKLIYPITKKFFNDYYLVNFDVDKKYINVFKKIDIEKVLNSEKFYQYDGYFFKAYPIRDFSNRIIGWSIFVKSEKEINQFFYKNNIFVRLFLLFSVVSMFIILMIYFYTKDKEKALKEQNLYYFKVLDSLQEIVILTDGKNLKYANKRFFEYFKDYKSIKEFSKKHKCICDFFVDEEGFLPAQKDGKSWTDILIENINKPFKVKVKYKGNLYIFLIKASKISENEYAVIFIDITKDYFNEQKLQIMAVTDKLTKLYNRSMFEKIFKNEIEKAKKDGSELWFAILDLDHFKRVNDTYGHQIGDKVLKNVAQIIKKSLRGNDLVFRIGGEEFAVIFKNLSFETVKNILERVRINIKNTKFNYLDKNITISIGAAKLHKDDDYKSLFNRADKLMYEAKKCGRDKTIIERDNNG